MKELGEELSARERTVDKTGNSDPKNREFYKRSEDGRHRENGAKRPPGPPTTTAMPSHTCRSSCCYCMGQHAADMCSKICKPEERRQALRDTGQCFICLKQGHLSRTCKSSGQCGQCNGQHHSSICFKATKEQ
uniref:CCHC-type domain-containing protein n=1 Tax=Amphimedon queenslandica TaxID=400682 RepID=A0A1X7URD8_AMPQE